GAEAERGVRHAHGRHTPRVVREGVARRGRGGVRGVHGAAAQRVGGARGAAASDLRRRGCVHRLSRVCVRRQSHVPLRRGGGRGARAHAVGRRAARRPISHRQLPRQLHPHGDSWRPPHPRVPRAAAGEGEQRHLWGRLGARAPNQYFHRCPRVQAQAREPAGGGRAQAG
ncbi:unnamed protein product, partial [Closterium sp. NIES-54]